MQSVVFSTFVLILIISKYYYYFYVNFLLFYVLIFTISTQLNQNVQVFYYDGFYGVFGITLLRVIICLLVYCILLLGSLCYYRFNLYLYYIHSKMDMYISIFI